VLAVKKALGSDHSTLGRNPTRNEDRGNWQRLIKLYLIGLKVVEMWAGCFVSVEQAFSLMVLVPL